jgi:molybdopterin/thiamine biosynthesis adenylyltransferase
MKHKIVKLPNGKLVRQQQDDLLSVITDIDVLAAAAFTYDNSIESASTPIPMNSSYNTGENRNPQRLAGHDIVIIGAGAIGSYSAFFLAPAQINIHLIDFKKVQFKHTQAGRTIYDGSLIGLYKVNAAKLKIESSFPGTKVIPLPYNIDEIPDIELQRLFSRSILVLLAFDDPAQLIRINKLAYPVVDFIQAAMHTAGLSGHIVISIPLVTPCLSCTLDIKRAEDIQRLDSEPANSWDIINVAQQTARIAIEIMYSKVTCSDITRWDTSKNLIYIANTKQQLSPDGPGLIYENSQRRPGCPVCNSPP